MVALVFPSLTLLYLVLESLALSSLLPCSPPLQEIVLPYSPLLLLKECNSLLAFLLLSLLSVTKKDIVKINCLGQGESIDSANSVDAPSESEGERDKK